MTSSTAEGIEVTDHDLVAPGVDEPVSDGSQISVQFGRPLALNVDGDARTYWVTSTTVGGRPRRDRPSLQRRRAVHQPQRLDRPRRA